MGSAGFVKKVRIIIAVILAAVLVCFVGTALTACAPNDLKYDDAIKIAKKDFGCEKILWITDNLALSVQPGSEPEIYKFRSPYSFYVVGEKNGEEIYLVIPCRSDLDKPYRATWGLDHTFAEVVGKLNENGANYIADVPDKYYVEARNYISFNTIDEERKGWVEYYDIGCGGEKFYERLDIKGVFYYRWTEGDTIRSCIVAQEGGELKAYTAAEPIS